MFSVSPITFICLIPRKTFIWYEVFLSQNFLDLKCFSFYLPKMLLIFPKTTATLLWFALFCRIFCATCFPWMETWDDPFWAHYTSLPPYRETGGPSAHPLGWVRELMNVSWMGTLQTPPKSWSRPTTLRCSQYYSGFAVCVIRSHVSSYAPVPLHGNRWHCLRTEKSASFVKPDKCTKIAGK